MDSPQLSSTLDMEAKWEVNNMSLQRTSIYILHTAPHLMNSCDHSNIFSDSRRGKECTE